MRLVACGNCHTQFDVTNVVDSEITCRCGAKVENRVFEGLEVAVHRCGSCGAQVTAEADDCAYCGSTIVRDDRELSLICPECFGRNSEASHYCTGCGVAFRPEQVDAGGEELPCPSCSVLMPVRAIGGIGINECPKCNGLWVPENRFDHLIAQACDAARERAGAAPCSAGKASAAGGSKPTVVYRSCPVCNAHMARRNFRKRSGVIIDRCNDHGTWLDADELGRIADFILEGGMGAGGAAEYARKAELDKLRRNEIAAMTRAVNNESIVIERHRPAPAGSGLIDLLKDLLS